MKNQWVCRLSLIAVFLMILAACQNKNAVRYTIGLSLSTLNNPFFVTLKEGAEAAAAEQSVALLVVDAQDDPEKEAANIESLIQKGVDALLVNPTDADAIVPSIQKANAAGIPVFTVDRNANGGEYVSHIASDNVGGGRMAGEYLCKLIGGSGSIVELEGIAGTSAARERGHGFNEFIKTYCSSAEIVARQIANFNREQGLIVFEDILQAQPVINGVFAHNDEMILGAIEAAEAAGRDGEMVFIGFDAVDDAVAAVDTGKLAATVALQPAMIGRLGVASAVEYLDGKPVDRFVPVALTLITAEQVETSAEPGASPLTLGLSLSTLNNPFFVTLKDGAEAMAAELGAGLVVVDARDDHAREAANIEDLIQRGVSALLINPTDADAIVPSIQKAYEAGIPVFTVDRSANGGAIVSHIGSDNIAGGQAAGKFLCEALGGSGKVVELEGIPGTSASGDRGLGFNTTLSSECSGLEIVARQTANFNRAEGLSVFENILQAQPAIDGVFAHNDEMILGAIEAAEAAGRSGEMIFVGFDAVDDAVAAINAGKLAATIAQQPELMGALGVSTAVRYLAGESVSEYISLELSLVTEETPVPTAGPPSGGTFTLGLSMSALNNPFFVTLKDGAELAASEKGIQLIVMDAQDDPAREASNIDDLIQRGVNALLINPTDADAIVPSIQKANEAGIPVFTLDRSAASGAVVSHIASDNIAGGLIAAEYLCESLGGVGNVVELEGIAGTSAARERGQGFNNFMSLNCAGAPITARQTANFSRAEGRTMFENLLKANPEIAGVFAHNDEMILGAIEAAKAVGRDGEIIFVGFDAIDEALAAVNAGSLAATIAQQPELMGILGVETAVRYLMGEDVSGYIPVDLALITQ
jgi:ribose transport system substrate-binding protein